VNKVIRIGTRDSELALWQATTVQKQLEDHGYKTELVPVKSLPIGIVQAAVLERAATQDILVHKGNPDYTQSCTIATGSLRRQAQWLNKDSNWTGAIFAKAGLERINVLPSNYEVLDWMTPAPAQGAMLIVALEDDDFCKTACAKLNHKATALCTYIEREFLRTLEGGCTAPIGASATIEDETIHFTGVLFSLDGKIKLEVNQSISISHSQGFGVDCALEILDNGGRELMKEIKASMNKK